VSTVHVGIDTGGTFTDFLVVHDGRAFRFKVPSTPAEPSLAFHRGLAEAARRLLAQGVDVAKTRPWEVAHGFTVATNALLSRTGARVAFVATSGFADLLTIGRQERPVLYALRPERAPSLVADDGRATAEADERTGPDGRVLTPLSAAALARLARHVRVLRPEAVAVTLLHAYAASGPERAVGRALARALPGVPVSLSHEVVRRHREVERASTTVVNAYVAPLVIRYLATLDAPRAHRLRVMQSNGGTAPAAHTARYPVHTVLSGPAGGVLGAYRIGRVARRPMLLTLDIGGTSTDVALVAGVPTTTREAVISGAPIAIPMLDVHTVGAGGGSIAAVDAGGALVVGPRSAGADPGPACYGKGGPATVTDAQVVLGRIPIGHFLDGAMALDADASWRVMAALGRALGLGGRGGGRGAAGARAAAVAAAQGVIAVADATIERALRLISVERGHDVRLATLVAFGGAGPLHACALAEALGAASVLVPPDAGVLSAWGLLGADERHDASRTVLWRLAPGAPWPRAAAARELGALEAQLLRAHGRDAAWRLTGSWALRYRGQSFELDVSAGAAGLAAAARDPRAAFARLHERRFGYARPGEAIEVVDVALSIARPGPRLPVASVPRRSAAGARLAPGLWRREELGRDARITGPARVVEYGATTWVPAGWRGGIDAHGNLVLTRGEGARR
jgi:N-methylhydantoinase A